MTKELVNKIKYNKHPKRKNNDLVAAMYAMYETGKSLEYIGGIYNRSRQAVYDVFKSRGYVLRSKQMKGLQVLDGYNFTLTRGGYLRGSVNGERILMHRYVWREHKGVIPKGFDIHHLDEDKTNNSVENLECLPKAEHSRKYSTGCNQYKCNCNNQNNI